MYKQPVDPNRSCFLGMVSDPPQWVPKLALGFSFGRYRVHTVAGSFEMNQVLNLRREAFVEQFGGKSLEFLNRVDDFDRDADVLAITDTRLGKVVGAYRLIASCYTSNFYTNSEFHLDRFLGLSGVKLELSRACISAKARNGVVIGLLWRGLSEYAQAIDARYLFGLSSVPTVDAHAAIGIFHEYSARGIVDLSLGIMPRESRKITALDPFSENVSISAESSAEALKKVPSLLKTYIKAGARICSYPVIDRDFQCSDFLTVLDWQTLGAGFVRRFVTD